MLKTIFDDWVKSEQPNIISELQIKANSYVVDLMPSNKKSIVSAINLDNQWHYTNKDKKCGYIGSKGIKNNNVPFIRLTVNTFNESHVFDSEAIITELWESRKNNQPYPHTQSKPIRQQNRVVEDYAEKARKNQSVQNEIASFDDLSPKPINNQTGYFDNKNITEMLNGNIRYGNNKDGEFGAILLTNINGEPRGLQRFYAKPIERLGGTNKPVTWGMDKTGACYTLGNVNPNTDSVVFCTGLANGLVLYFVFQIPVVICLDDGNLKHVIKAFKAKYPKPLGIIVCDNDKWKYDRTDNSGILKGIMAAQLADYQYVIPEFNDTNTAPTDVCDLYNLEGIDTVKSLLKYAEKAPIGHDWHLKKLGYIGLRDTDKSCKVGSKELPTATKPLFMAVRGLCSSAMHQTPLATYESMREQVIDLVKMQFTRLGQFKRFSENEQKRLLEYVDFRLGEDCNNLIRNATRRISPEMIQRINNNDGKVIHFDLELIDGKLRIPKQIADKIIDDKDSLNILAAQMNTGKTYSIITPLSQKAKLNIDFPMLFVHLISLSKALSKQTKTTSYLDIKTNQEANDCDSICACINSGNKQRLKSLRNKSRLTVIDEIDANYDAIAIGTVPKREKKPLFDQVQSMLVKDKALVTSADIDDLSLRYLLKTKQTNQIKLYIGNHAKTRNGQKLLVHSDYNTMITEAIKNAKGGKKLLIVADSVPIIEAIYKRLVKLEIKAIAITKNTSEKHNDFISQVNKMVSLYDVVLGTPSIAHGLSFDTGYFDAVYGIYCQVATIDTFGQMISRDRNPKRVNVAFKSNRRKFDDLKEQIENAQDEAMAAALRTVQIVKDTDGLPDYALIPQKRVEFTDFDKFHIDTVKTQQFELDINVLLRRLVADGMMLEYVEYQKEDVSIAKKESKEIRKEYTQAKIDEIVIKGNNELKSLTHKDIVEIAKETIDKRVRSTKEKTAMLYMKYNVSKVTEAIVKFDNNEGGLKINRLDKTLSSRHDSTTLDALELDNLPTTLLSHNSIQLRFNNLLLNSIGLHFDEEFNPIRPENIRFNGKSELIQKLVSIACKHKKEFNGAMSVKITPKTHASPLIFIRNWLGSLGVSLTSLEKTDKCRNYGVNVDMLKVILAPIKARKQNCKNRFQQEIETYLQMDNPALGNPVLGNPVPGNPANPAPGNPVPGNPVPDNPAPGNPVPGIKIDNENYDRLKSFYDGKEKALIIDVQKHFKMFKDFERAGILTSEMGYFYRLNQI